MLYTPHSPMQLADAILGQLTLALVFIFDHLVPAVHKLVSWDQESTDLGPIIPEWSGPSSKKLVPTLQSHAHGA